MSARDRLKQNQLFKYNLTSLAVLYHIIGQERVISFKCMFNSSSVTKGSFRIKPNCFPLRVSGEFISFAA